MVYEREGRIEEALAIDQELLSLNPNDNQGVRALAVTVLFALKHPEEVIKVCTAYPDDGMPEVAYGRALALFQLGLKTDQATTALKEAVRWRPRVAAELLKTRHRRPQSSIPGYDHDGGCGRGLRVLAAQRPVLGKDRRHAPKGSRDSVRTVSQRRGRQQGNA